MHGMRYGTVSRRLIPIKINKIAPFASSQFFYGRRSFVGVLTSVRPRKNCDSDLKELGTNIKVKPIQSKLKQNQNRTKKKLKKESKNQKTEIKTVKIFQRGLPHLFVLQPLRLLNTSKRFSPIHPFPPETKKTFFEKRDRLNFVLSPVREHKSASVSE